MRGRKPKPVEVRRREGNPGRRPLPEPVLIGGRAAPRMPSYLPRRAKTAWRQIVPRLDEVGMLDRVDGPALEALCVQVAIMRQATAEIADLDSLVTLGSKGQPVPHPLLPVLASAQNAVRQWTERFGLDPSTRTRLGLSELHRRSLASELNDQLGPAVLRAVD
jgi:P27 family predicted phage terminase small subunit